jgi:hypothetical protein
LQVESDVSHSTSIDSSQTSKHIQEKKLKSFVGVADSEFKREQKSAKFLSAPLPLKKAAFWLPFLFGFDLSVGCYGADHGREKPERRFLQI